MTTREDNLEHVQPDPEELWHRLNQPPMTRLEILRQCRDHLSPNARRELEHLERVETLKQRTAKEPAVPPTPEDLEMDAVILSSRKLAFDLIIAKQNGQA